MQDQQEELLVPLPHAAERAGMSEASLRRAIADGKLAAMQDEAGTTAVNASSLDSWVLQMRLRRGTWEDERHCAVRVAAQLVGCSKTIIKNALRESEIQGERGPGGYWLVERESLKEWMSRKPPPESELQGEFLSSEQAAALAGLRSVNTLLSAIKRGQLEAVRVRTGVGPHPYRIAVGAFNAWLRLNNPRFDTSNLKGELVSVEEAAEHFGVNAEVLGRNIKRGRVPGARRLSPGQPYVVGMDDVAEWVQGRREVREGKIWTLGRLSRFSGIERHRLVRAIQSGELKSAVVPNLAGGRPMFRFEPADIAKWMQESCPPYSAAVMGLPPFLTSAATLWEAARLAGLTRAEIETAVEAGELESVPVPTLGAGEGYLVARHAFDAWCASKGKAKVLGPLISLHDAEVETGLSARVLCAALQEGQLRGKLGEGRGARTWIERESLQQWTERYGQLRDGTYATIQQAAEISGYAVPTIALAIKTGRIKAVRGPARKRWLVERESLQQWMNQLPNPAEVEAELEAVSVSQAASQTGVSAACVLKAINAGKIKAIVARGPGGPVFRVLPDSLARWSAERKRLSLVNLDGDRMTIAAAAKECGLSKGVLSGAIWLGKLRVEAVDGPRGRQYVVTRTELEAWLANRATRKTTPVQQ